MEKENAIAFIPTSKTDFEILFRTYYSSLCAYANNFLKDPDTSEEVVQEIMFKLWVNRKSLSVTTSLQGYLFRAVRNGCLNVLKHNGVVAEYKSIKEVELELDQHSAGEPMIMTELQQKIRQAIDHLPLERRKVFVMSRYDGLTYREIAEKLNISVKTVENQIGKALKTLKEELAEYLPLVILLFFDF